MIEEDYDDTKTYGRTLKRACMRARQKKTNITIPLFLAEDYLLFYSLYLLLFSFSRHSFHVVLLGSLLGWILWEGNGREVIGIV